MAIPTTRMHVQVARAVELCTARHSLAAGEQCSAAELASALQHQGYAARLHKSAGGGSGTAAFRNLRHTFVTVDVAATTAQQAQHGAGQPCCRQAASEDGDAGATPVLVDSHFACQVR